ncbi:zinc finger protein 20-like [Sciurus carolinensis]|uniref:zinc finger protein 20-like n=1 Tax=Sciurus carolinensis TaxID=30640 RepID=UPI001FB1E997|nr:zinc finger protein 20-like [Sciurus carolinensis]
MDSSAMKKGKCPGFSISVFASFLQDALGKQAIERLCEQGEDSKCGDSHIIDPLVNKTSSSGVKPSEHHVCEFLIAHSSLTMLLTAHTGHKAHEYQDHGEKPCEYKEHGKAFHYCQYF